MAYAEAQTCRIKPQTAQNHTAPWPAYYVTQNLRLKKYPDLETVLWIFSQQLPPAARKNPLLYGDLASVPSIYGYAGQNPTQNIDPLGLEYGDAWDPRTYIPINIGIGGAVEVSNIDSWAIFSKDPSNTGGTYGINFECTLNGGCHWYDYSTPKNCPSKGVNIGFGAQGNIGISSDPLDSWTGLFDNYTASVGPGSGTYFQSPAGQGNWLGGSVGPSFGTPIGAGYTRTNYERTFPNSPAPSSSSSQCNSCSATTQ